MRTKQTVLLPFGQHGTDGADCSAEVNELLEHGRVHARDGSAGGWVGQLALGGAMSITGNKLRVGRTVQLLPKAPIAEIANIGYPVVAR
jgi:hypothetical protein